MVRLTFRRAAKTTTDAAAAAETLLTVAVLLGAGVDPAAAWRHLARTGGVDAERVADAVEDGTPIPAALARLGGAWTEVAAAWAVATTVGAPLGDALRSIAVSLRDAHEAADDVRVALAEPAGTARLMGWLPLVAIGLSLALGFDTLGVLLGNPFGIACLIAGVVLIVVAQRWNAALVRRARAGGAVPGLEAELLAVALRGGVSIDRARAVVAAARADAAAVGARAFGASGPAANLGGDGAASSDDPAPDAADSDAASSVDGILALSRGAGVPAVELLRASAELARHRARVDGRLRAAQLSSRLLLPLGVCTLPAFLLLGVAPMLLSVVSTTVVPIP